MCNLQLLNLTDLSLIDDVMPDRAKFGCTKAASACTSDDIHMLVQSIWLRECVGPWHSSLAQFVEGVSICHATGGYRSVSVFYADILHKLHVSPTHHGLWFSPQCNAALVALVQEAVVKRQY